MGRPDPREHAYKSGARVVGQTTAKDGTTGELMLSLITLRVEVIEEVSIGVHLKPCARCKVLSPPPSAAQLHAMGSERLFELDTSYLHAATCEDTQDYVPEGWGGIGDKLLCGTCLPIVKAAFDAAMEK